MIEVTILGSGASLGVPVLGCSCRTCLSGDRFNTRSRPSIVISKNQRNVLVDFGFDIKAQLMREKIYSLECAILTHDHADHVGGIDELRVFSHLQGNPLPIYTDSRTVDIISNRYRYMINEKRFTPHELSDFECLVNLADIDIEFFRQHHGSIDSLGIKIGDFVYSNDVIAFPDESEKYLQNMKYWVVDCMDYTSTSAHSGLDKVLEWNEIYKPEFIYLVNMSHNIDYYEIQSKIPANIKPAYDGLKLQI